MSTGKFFSGSDDDARQAPSGQSRKELEKLKAQFLNKARGFMDDTALGEGRKALHKLMQKVKGEAADSEEDPAEAELPRTAYAPGTLDTSPETDWDEADGDFEEDPDEAPEALDWSRPEYIRAGYAKPGTHVEKPKTLEEAQEESMNMRFGNLSSLLGRFGSEDAAPEAEAPAAAGRRLEMDKAHFTRQMQAIHALLQAHAQMPLEPACWLYPEVLTLLRSGNSPQRILLFCMAALFAQTPENYLTQSDQDWIHALMERAGFLLEPALIQRQIDQTFIYPERVHRLYQSFLDEPLQIVPAAFEQYRQNLVKLYIGQIAARYDADPQNVIRTLAACWQTLTRSLQQAWQAVQPVEEQCARFQARKMNSASLVQKRAQLEAVFMAAYAQLQALARDIEALKQVTRLIEEEEALAKLQQFPTALFVLPAQRTGDQPLSLLALRRRFGELGLAADTEAPFSLPLLVPELSALEQKRAIGRAKEGELKSLYLLQHYKRAQISQTETQQRPAAEPKNPAAE